MVFDLIRWRFRWYFNVKLFCSCFHM